MLFFSCSQYEIRNEVIERAVDFSIYDSYKNGEIKLLEYKRSDKKLSNLNVYDDATKQVNEFYGTNIELPKNFFETFETNDKNYIKKTALKNGWINEKDLELADKIVEDITNESFDIAINNLQNKILTLNLTEEEFSKKNVFVNMLKIKNDISPLESYSNSGDYYQKSSGIWGCLWAVVVVELSLVSLLSCATWIMCGFAVYGVYTAFDYLHDQCKDIMK